MYKYEIGNKVKCVSEHQSLTVGKEYEIVRVSDFKITVVTDTGHKWSHTYDKFEEYHVGNPNPNISKYHAKLLGYGIDYPLLCTLHTNLLPVAGQEILVEGHKFKVWNVIFEYEGNACNVAMTVKTVESRGFVKKLMSLFD